MPNVRFFLDKPGGVDPTSIIISFSFEGKRLKYSTGKKILPEYWNQDKQQARYLRGFKEGSELNQFLINLKGEVNRIYLQMVNNGTPPTVSAIRLGIDHYLNKSQPKQQLTFIKFIERLKEERAENPEFSEATIKVYQTTINKLDDYRKKRNRGKPLQFDDMTTEVLNKFKYFLLSQQFSNNYINKILVTVKTFLNAAEDEKIYKSENWQLFFKKHMVSKEDAVNVYLSIDELRVLYHLDLSKNEKLDRVRDLFIIECFTGLRYSDFSRINPDHFSTTPEGVEILRIETKKTKQVVYIPLHPFVKGILSKYNGGLPRQISSQKMNLYLKELCKEAKINDPIIKTTTKGGKRNFVTLKKYEMISSHTARRSFATNAFKAGVDSLLIMKITGHTTEKSFKKYLKFTQEEAAAIMAKSKFYKFQP